MCKLRSNKSGINRVYVIPVTYVHTIIYYNTNVCT